MFIKGPYFLRSPDEPAAGGEDGGAGDGGGGGAEGLYNIEQIESVLGIGDPEGDPSAEEAAAEAEAAKAAEAEAAKKAEEDAAAAAAKKAEEEEAAAAAAKKSGKAAKEPEGDPEPQWFDDLDLGVDLKKAASNFKTRDELLKALGIDGEPDWRNGIGDSKLKEHAGRFASPTDLVKAHMDLRQQVGRAIVIPPRNATKEQMADFTGKLNKMLGVPDSPDGYEFPNADGQEPDEGQLAARKSWAAFFHEHSVPKVTADAMLAKFNDDVETGKERVIEADHRFAEQEEAALKSEWGEDFDVNKTLAARAASRLFGDDLETLKTTTTEDGRLLMDNRIFLRMLSRVGREMSEGAMDTMTASEKETIQGQVEDLRKRQEEARSKGNTREANKLYKEEQELLAKISGKQPIVGAEGRAA